MQDWIFIYEFKIGLIKIMIYEQHDCMYGSMYVSTRLDTRMYVCMYVWKRHVAGDPLLFPGSQA